MKGGSDATECVDLSSTKPTIECIVSHGNSALFYSWEGWDVNIFCRQIWTRIAKNDRKGREIDIYYSRDNCASRTETSSLQYKVICFG